MLCKSTPYNCSIALQQTELDENPDITGIGVIVSWTISASVCFVLIIYLSFPTKWRQRLGETDQYTKAIHRILLAFGDQQLLTGTIIQIAAYIQFCSIHGKYFLIVWLLASSSTMVHLCVLCRLRDFFARRSTSIRFRGVAIIINALMLALTAIIMRAMDYTWFIEENSTANSSLLAPTPGCIKRPVFSFFFFFFLDLLILSFPFFMVYSLIVGAIVAMIEVPEYPTTVDTSAALMKPLIVSSAFSFALAMMLHSSYFEIEMANISGKWGFGQLLAMLSLLFPTFSVVEAFKEQKASTNNPLVTLTAYSDQATNGPEVFAPGALSHSGAEEVSNTVSIPPTEISHASEVDVPNHDVNGDVALPTKQELGDIAIAPITESSHPHTADNPDYFMTGALPALGRYNERLSSVEEFELQTLNARLPNLVLSEYCHIAPLTSLK